MNDSPTPAPSSPRRSRAHRLVVGPAVGLLALLLAAGLAELGLRLLGPGYDAAAARAELVRAVVASRQLVAGPERAGKEAQEPEPGRRPRAHPYLGFEFEGEAQWLDTVLARAFADTWNERPFVLVLGGSVAQMFGPVGTSRLEERLAADPRWTGPRPRVVSLGRGGYKQPQQVVLLTHLLTLGVEPDVVVLLDGFNEVALGWQNVTKGFHPSFPAAFLWTPMAGGRATQPAVLRRTFDLLATRERLEERATGALEIGLPRSAIGGRWALTRLRDDQRRVGAAVRAYRETLLTGLDEGLGRGPRDPRVEQDGIGECVRVWREAARATAGLCGSRGIRCLVVLQPTLHDPGAKPMTEEERANGAIDAAWLHGVVEGYPRLREAGVELAREGVSFLDASRAFASVEEPLYVDNCHLGDAGNRLLADAIADTWFDLLPPR